MLVLLLLVNIANRDTETDILEIRKADQYEAALYWGSQLFFENWDTSPVHVVDSPQEVSMKPEA